MQRTATEARKRTRVARVFTHSTWSTFSLSARTFDSRYKDLVPQSPTPGQKTAGPKTNMKASTVTRCVMLGCAAAAPVAAFTVGPAAMGGLTAGVASTGFRGRARSAPQQQAYGRRNRAAVVADVRMMAVDLAAVHSLGDYVNVVSSAGMDQAWLSHVVHGESRAWIHVCCLMCWLWLWAG